MSLTLRQSKGSKLTIQEMDGNLTYLQTTQEFTSNGVNMTVQLNSQGIELKVDGGGGKVIKTSFKSPNWVASPEIGVYTNIVPTSDSDSGTGLVLTIEIGADVSKNIEKQIVTNQGTGYKEGDVITINTTQLGYDGGVGEDIEYALGKDDVSELFIQRIIIKNEVPENVNILMPDLIKTDPVVKGALWNDAGYVAISNGVGDVQAK